MKAKELRAQSVAELTRALTEQRERVRALRFKVGRDEHKDVRDLRDAKKLVARILTILKQKQSPHP